VLLAVVAVAAVAAPPLLLLDTLFHHQWTFFEHRSHGQATVWVEVASIEPLAHTMQPGEVELPKATCLLIQ
jgi:hypothetical protein